jgi:hypothetical protein
MKFPGFIFGLLLLNPSKTTQVTSEEQTTTQFNLLPN